jgi:response regulator NasT
MPARVLIIDAQSERTQRLTLALAEAGFEVVGIVGESDDVHGAVRSLRPDAILIDTDSPTRDTLEGLAVLGKRFPRPILMLSESSDADLVRDATRLGISTYAVDGLSPVLLRSLVEVTMAQFHNQRSLAGELREALQALQDRRVIDKAKYRLVQEMHMSEEDAYHQLRRMAMERGMKIAELARQLIERGRPADVDEEKP